MSTGSKMRVYEIAKELGVPNKELIKKIRALGFEINNHMSSLDISDVARVRKSIGVDGPPAEAKASSDGAKPIVKKKPPARTVLRRRVKKDDEQLQTVESAVKGDTGMKRTVVRRRPKVDDLEMASTVRAEAEAANPSPPVQAAEPAPQAPAPVPTPAPAVEATSVEAPVAAEAAPPETPAKRPVSAFVKGPASISIPGVKFPKPKPVETAPPAAPKIVPPEPTGPPISADDYIDDGQTRFQRELERAREQATIREQTKSEVEAKPKSTEPDEPRPEGRPAVGTVIELPMTRIKITERAANRPGPGPGRGRFANSRNSGPGGKRHGGRDMRKRPRIKGSGNQTQITMPAEHKRVIRIEETTTVADLGKHMGIKAQDLLKKLWTMGMVGVTINAQIDFETANLLASEFHYDVQNVAFKEESVFESEPDSADDMMSRAPVVTVMGHVDHGKTSLLDYIRKAKVASGEAGGITQHIGAYRVSPGETYGEMVFLDTPGHAAFTEMRARGAQATDIVILVAAADDGVMPQTIEAIKHAKEAKVPIIVAVNKCDLPGANPEKVRQQCADHGLIPEEWGGDTMYVDVSAATGDGIDKLLEGITLNAELLELQANPYKPALGVVVEARLDKARGPMSTILIQEGTLRVGEIVVCGEFMGKVRAMLNDKGESVEVAGPSTPIELLGIDGVPEAGETLNASTDEKMAKQVVENRRQAKRRKELASSSRVSLENLMDKIKGGSAQEELKVVLKADVQGSAEAVKTALIELSTEKVAVRVIASGVGGVTETDVNLAKAGGAIVVGFHVRPAGKAAQVAQKEGVEIRIYDIIYQALDDLKIAMAGLLAPIKREVAQGTMEVRDTFVIPRRGKVAGCMVTDGRITRKSLIRVIRDSVHIYEGRVNSLRRFKDEAAEVKNGYECGVMLEGFNDLEVGDIMESYEIVEEAATL